MVAGELLPLVVPITDSVTATDGSPHAEAAIAATAQFPWPPEARVRAMSAGRTRGASGRSPLVTTLDARAAQAADAARPALARRWPDADIEVVDDDPVTGILGAAARFPWPASMGLRLPGGLSHCSADWWRHRVPRDVGEGGRVEDRSRAR